MATGVELAAVKVELIPGIAGADNITIGTSTITSGTTGRVLYDDGGVIGELPVTGSAGNVVLSVSPTLNAIAMPAGGTTGAGLHFSTTTNFGVFFGSGAPTLSAAQGSLYLRSDGSTTITRMYVNTDGGTTWTPVTTVG